MEVIIMNKSVRILCLAAIFFCSLLFSPVFGQQTDKPSGGVKSNITIKTMKIENGDTIVTEKHYETEGDANIHFNDSIEGFGNSGFYQFHYNMIPDLSDSGFFDQSWLDMPDLMKDFNGDIQRFFDLRPGFDRSFQLNADSLFRNFYFPDMDSLIDNTLPDIKNDPDKLKKSEKAKIHPFYKLQDKGPKTSGRNIFLTDLSKDQNKKGNDEQVPGFDMSLNATDGYVNLSFMLHARKASVITLSTVKEEVLITENTGKGEGLFTRQFDLNQYPSGVYFVTVSQGKARSGRRIIIQ